LEDGPGYHVLHLIAHGNPFGALLLEEGRGWTRFVGAGELAAAVGDSVRVLVLGACHGERILAGLSQAEPNGRPPVMVFAQGEYPVPTRAIHLFSENFYHSMVRGKSSSEAFRKGVERVQRDDFVGEVACPDGVSKDRGPSPFRRLRIIEDDPVSFAALATGESTVTELRLDRPIHVRGIRSSNLLLGRETAIARLIEELLPPGVGIREPKSPLINLHGEGGIGKTHLGQAVCDTLEDYRFFQGGIYEIDVEPLRDSASLALTVLRALGVDDTEAGPDPVAALPKILRQISDNRGPVLLMLDNVDPLFQDSVVEEASSPSQLLKSMLAECPSLRVLTTCRTWLYLGGYEYNFLVDPIAAGPARDLFIQGIPDTDVRDQILSLPKDGKVHVERLISALEGHPLSVFLAAYRIGSGPDPVVVQLAHAHQDLAALLDDPKLTGLPVRQRSLRASLDLSFARLSERGRAFLPRAGRFPGGLFRHVPTLDNLLGPDWREIAEECRGLGLLRLDRDDQRYRMLNPVREYAEALLGEPGFEFRRKLARHWARFAVTNDLLLNPVQNKNFMVTLDLPTDGAARYERLARLHEQACAAFLAEEANILFAFRWAVDHDFEPAQRIAASLGDYLATYDKRQINAWLAQKTMEKAEDPATKAGWLNNLGKRLSDLGDREGAKDKAREAVEIWRKLAEKHPEIFLPDLAMSLNNLGAWLSALGDHVGAKEKTEEALRIYRELVKKHPEAFLPDLAMCLNNLGNRLAELGDYEEAKEKTEEALGIYRELAKKHPEAFLPGLARSLNNLGNRLSKLGDRTEAKEKTEEALCIYRELAKKHPKAFLPDLAMSLNNLGHRLSELGDHEGSKEKTEEALRIYRELAKKHPEAFLPDVAKSMNNLGNWLSALGDREGAKEKTEEALRIYRELAKKHPEAFLSNLAMSLNNLGIMLFALGDHVRAKEKTEEALGVYRELARHYPKAFLPELVTTLNNLGSILVEIGDQEATLSCFQSLIQVGELYASVSRNPTHLVQAYRRLAGFLAEVKRNDEALVALEKAVGILKPIAESNPAALQDLVEVNEERLEIIKALNGPGIVGLAREIDDQKRRPQELVEESNHPEDSQDV
jgi:tetratricopeptide (TPR) repeat protein